MELADRFTVRAASQEVWALLWDLPRVGLCLPGCENIEAVDDTNLKARFAQKVGPFQIAMDLDLTVLEMTENKRVVVVGGGKDTRGNTLKLSSLTMELLASSGDETEISYSMDFNLYGRLATLGNAIVKRKAEEMRVQFTERITAELEGT